VTGGFAAGGSWAIRFPAPDKIKFFGVVKGSCWLCLDGEEAPVSIESGDVFLLSAQRSFVLTGDLAEAGLTGDRDLRPGNSVERDLPILRRMD
jgi:hypothetical protein